MYKVACLFRKRKCVIYSYDEFQANDKTFSFGKFGTRILGDEDERK